MTNSPQDFDPAHKPRGLWAVIAQSSEAITAEQETDSVQNPAEPELNDAASVAPRSLFAVMQHAQAAEHLEQVGTVESSHQQSDATSLNAAMPLHAVHVSSGGESIEPIMSAIDRHDNLPRFFPKRSPQPIRQSSIALLCGLASIALSPLSIRAEVWMSIPAFGAGFFAIVMGYLALTSCRLRNLSTLTKTASQFAMLLGTLGIFLGPLVFAPVGRELRQSSGHQQAHKHSTVIGDGLRQ